MRLHARHSHSHGQTRASSAHPKREAGQLVERPGWRRINGPRSQLQGRCRGAGSSGGFQVRQWGLAGCSTMQSLRSVPASRGGCVAAARQRAHTALLLLVVD
jgi:hypothetical protein